MDTAKTVRTFMQGVDTTTAPIPFVHVRIAVGAPQVRGQKEFFSGHCFAADAGAHPEGIFASWQWDGASLQVTCDRYGFYPLFYATAPGELWVSPSVTKLIQEGAPAELDVAAFGVFVRFQNLIADRTFFRSIRTVPRSGQLRWANGQLSADDRILISKPVILSRDCAIDGYSTLFTEAIRKCTSAADNSVLSLSGGRDSRHILFALDQVGRLPKCAYTAVRSNFRTDECAVAQAVASRVGVPHQLCPAAARSLSGQRAMLRLCHLATSEHAWSLPLRDAIDPNRELYDGIGGDVMSAGLFLEEQQLDWFRAGRWEDLASYYFAYDPAAIRRDLVDGASYEAAKELLISELRRHAEAPNPPGSFMFWNRTRRTIAVSPYGIFGRQRCVFAPYLDHNVWNFLASLPAEDLLDHALHTDTIARTYPHYADLPYFPGSEHVPIGHKASRQIAISLLGELSRSNRSLLNSAWLIPRLVRVVVDPSYRGMKWLFNDVVHAMELAKWLR